MERFRGLLRIGLDAGISLRSSVGSVGANRPSPQSESRARFALLEREAQEPLAVPKPLLVLPIQSSRWQATYHEQKLHDQTVGEVLDEIRRSQVCAAILP